MKRYAQCFLTLISLEYSCVKYSIAAVLFITCNKMIINELKSKKKCKSVKKYCAPGKTVDQIRLAEAVHNRKCFRATLWEPARANITSKELSHHSDMFLRPFCQHILCFQWKKMQGSLSHYVKRITRSLGWNL